ncbi:MAG TPA: hypothetical protein VKZ91_11240 [Woeseiaceae bacterium]|nr:hypothetical protein [Woeseiaceae bacterium]
MDIAEILSEAERDGYRLNFALEEDALRCPETGLCFGSNDIKAVYSRSVDTGTDPGDDATVYLIETTDGRKGYFLIADSFHVNPRSAAFVQDLVRGRGTQPLL